MSQRRSVNPNKPRTSAVVVSEEPATSTVIVKGSLSLEKADTALEEKVPLSTASSLDEAGGVVAAGPSPRVKHWKESPFAVGLTEPTWEAELRSINKRKDDDPNAPLRFEEDFVPIDNTGCLCCSALVCSYLGAGRVGNIAVLHSSTEWVEEVEQDEETGEEKITRYTRPNLNWVVGPFWPMLFCVTYPLIFAVSGWAFKNAILPGNKHPMLVFAWFVLTFGLIAALAMTGCRDPGILYRHSKPPPQNENNWRWNDQALTYRPRNAHYDTDTAVVVEEFDHTCPWTGTAIGKRNMFAFQMFVCLVFLCLIVDIFLITGAL